MTEENIFDPLLKKKKKKKKCPFDLSTLEDSSTNDGGNEHTHVSEKEREDSFSENVSKEDNDLIDDDKDFDDFSELKKKKKKKKKISLEELKETEIRDEVNNTHTSAPTEERDLDETTLDELDFTLPKKKKKKKRLTLDEFESEFPIGEEEEEDGETKFEDDIETKLTVSSSQQQWIGSDRDYSYDELLIRVFNIMRERNPDMVAGEKRRFIMRPPQVLRVGTKKTSFANFLEICKMVHRQPKHLEAFLLAELGTSGSVDANNQLIIKGRFLAKQIENVLRRYIKEYVTCHTCRSPDTILSKEIRLFFIQCGTCGSRCSVASIKSGFQAVTGKRAAIRAKIA